MKKTVLLCMMFCAGICGRSFGAGPEDYQPSRAPEMSLQEALILGTEDATGNCKLLREPVMTLKEALIRGIQSNLDIKVSQTDVAMANQKVIQNKSVFDPYVDASLYTLQEKSPTTSSSYSIDALENEKTGVSAGVGDKMAFGLKSRISARSVRTSDNSPSSDLDPQYRNALVLELTQPLLKDLGMAVNTADLRVAENQAKQARLKLVSRANEIIRAIEKTYYELDRAIQNLQFRIESRELALTLLQANKKKFESGVVPISEVQSAETTVASRDEQILYAIQQAEVISDQLKDLLNIRKSPDPKNPDAFYTDMIVPEEINRTKEAVPDLDTALAVALNNRPELKLQKLNIDNKDIRLVFYKNQRLPRVDLVGTLGVNGLAGDSRATTYSGNAVWPSEYDGNFGDAFSSMADADGYSWKLGVNFMYPLGNRSAKALYTITQQGKKQAVYRFQRIESRFETDVKNALVNVNRSLQRVTVADRFEELAAITLEQEMKKLAEGLSDSFRIVNYQANLIEAKVRKAAAMSDVNKGLSDLYYSMGTILDQHHMTTKFNTKEILRHEK